MCAVWVWAFYRKWLRDFKDAQRPDGQLPKFTASHRDICVKRTGQSLTVTVPCPTQITVGEKTQSVCPGTYTYKI